MCRHRREEDRHDDGSFVFEIDQVGDRSSVVVELLQIDVIE